MRHALILAGGSGTRLWPMSRAGQPKQLIPFLNGKSLLQVAAERLGGFIDPSRVAICALAEHRQSILDALPALRPENYIGEPVGRDTVNAIALSSAVIGRRDPDAVIGVFTADHLIEPVDEFQRIVARGYELAERDPATLVTFGIEPDGPATSFGYLELGDPIGETARVVRQFREKPDAATARTFFDAGPERYLWNSGMFVWRAATYLDCLARYEPGMRAGIDRIAPDCGNLAEVYPTLRKISVDYAVMEPASRDPLVRVAAVPMKLDWLDVGSWPMFARTCPTDEQGNSVSAGRTLLLDTARSLVASSDPAHIVATLGCEDLIVIHTPDATLVCHRDRAEGIKDLHKLVGERFGKEWQ
jgi:mannose-1-phosphate guanylyltransferase